MVNPKGDPGQHHDENGGEVSLKDEVAHVSVQLKTQRQPRILSYSKNKNIKNNFRVLCTQSGTSSVSLVSLVEHLSGGSLSSPRSCIPPQRTGGGQCPVYRAPSFVRFSSEGTDRPCRNHLNQNRNEARGLHRPNYQVSEWSLLLSLLYNDNLIQIRAEGFEIMKNIS